MLSAIAMTVLLVVAFATFGHLMYPRVRLLVLARSENRFDNLGQRIVGTLKYAFGQWRMPRDPIAGFAHIFIFFGFLVLTIATTTHFVHAYAHGWHFPGLGGRVGEVYTLIKDLLEILVLVAVIYGMWRRLKPTPSRVGRSWEGVFVLGMIAFLMVTDFLIAGAELVRAGHSGLPWSPGGYLGVLVLAPLAPEPVHLIGAISYWTHCAAVLVFLNFLPIGKHFHVITAIPKVFFRDLRPYGELPKLDLENAESFGMRSTADLTWSMILDTYSCTECGRCTLYCPTSLTGKPLAHRQLNLDLKKAIYADKSVLLNGKRQHEDALPDLVSDERISADTIWSCTTCGSCEQECPVLIENVQRIVQMRQHKVLMEGDVSPELARAFKGMENNNNPWGIGFDQRDAWAEGLDIPRMADVMADRDEAPLLYWVGCAGSFDDRNKKITVAVVQILKAAGVDFAILGQEEGCTGDSARRAGNEYLFQAMAEANVELLNNYKVKRILTHCPHCMHTLKVDYPQFGGSYEVIHHTQLIQELIASGKIKPTKPVDTVFAVHDSCYLGRYHDIYDAPRQVIRAVPGAKVLELPRSQSRSVCCGAGGGRFWMEEHIGERINVHRAKEAAASQAGGVCSACPFCLTMLKDGLAELEKEDMKTLDVAEIVAGSLPG